MTRSGLTTTPPARPSFSARRTFRSDESGEFEEGSNQNRLRDQHIAHISGTFHAYTDVEKCARVVPLVEITENGWNPNIALCGCIRGRRPH